MKMGAGWRRLGWLLLLQPQILAYADEEAVAPEPQPAAPAATAASAPPAPASGSAASPAPAANSAPPIQTAPAPPAAPATMGNRPAPVPAPAPTAASAPVPKAAATPPPPPVTWKATGQMGLIYTDTSTDANSNFNAKLHWEEITGNWAHEINVDGVTTHDDISGVNTDSYIINTKSKYAETHLNYGFEESEWQKDSASAFDYQVFVSGGLGHYFIKSTDTQFNVELGLGLRHSQPESNDVITNFNANYHWQMSKTMSINEKLEVQNGRTNFVAHSVSELKQNITSALAFSFSYDFRHDSSGAGDTDNITSISLIYQLH